MAVLGWVRERWNMVLEPVIRVATGEQKVQLEELWKQELAYWNTVRGLQGDSLRKPLTQVRSLIKQLPLTEENSVVNVRTQEREHIALDVFNLAEEEWVRMNAHSQDVTHDRLAQQQLLERPDAIVHQALLLIQSPEWAELVVGLALCTGRRLAELLKTATFTEKEPYTVLFSGQVKGRGREETPYEIPTLVRSFLVVEGVQRLRRLIDCTSLEVEEVSQRYGRAVNEVVHSTFGDLIPVRTSRERLTVHVLRTVYARLATYWYAPPQVADITYMAYIQGHRFILEPQVEAGETPTEIERKRLNYASNANYFDYKVGDGHGNIDGRQGIRLGQPGVTVLDAFRPQTDEAEKASEADAGSGRRKRRTSQTKEEKAGGTARAWIPITVRRPTRDWLREVGETMASEGRSSASTGTSKLKDDDILRKLLTAYVIGEPEGASGQTPNERAASAVTLEMLDLPEATRALLQQGMALAASTDGMAFLVAAAEREARQLVNLAQRHESRHYETLPTSKLEARDAQASQERFRRAVHATMQWNRIHRPLEQWYITVLGVQKLVGGRKDLIKAYLDAHAEEIEQHHTSLGITPSYNRKPGGLQIQDAVEVPEDPAWFPQKHDTERAMGEPGSSSSA